ITHSPWLGLVVCCLLASVGLHIYGLWAPLCIGLAFIAHLLALVWCLLASKCRNMHENIVAAVGRGDKSITLLMIARFNTSVFHGALVVVNHRLQGGKAVFPLL